MEPLDLTLSILKTKCVWQSESNFNAKHLGKKIFMGFKTWQCALNNHDISVPLGCNCGAREWEGRLGGEGGFHEGGWGEDVSVSCFLFYTLWYYLTSSSPYIYKTIKIAIVFSLSCPHTGWFFNLASTENVSRLALPYSEKVLSMAAERGEVPNT